MQSINYKIKIGATSYTPSDRPFLVEVQSKAALSIPLHSCRVVLGQADSISAKPEDAVSISLGYGDRLYTIFTGIVQSVEAGIESVTIRAVSALYPLTWTRFNKIYEKPTAGNIVTDIAQKRLKLKVNKIESGLKFPVYALGNRATAHAHIATLAHQCGFDFYADAEDKIIFAKHKAAKTHAATYGNNLLRLVQKQTIPAVTGVEIYGESPASQGQGDQAYSWLTKKEVKGSTGKTSSTMVRAVDPTARTQAIAKSIAQAVLDQKTQKACGQARVLGDGAIHLGDAVKLEKMPATNQNGTFKIVGVTHQLSRLTGFYTNINWEDV